MIELSYEKLLAVTDLEAGNPKNSLVRQEASARDFQKNNRPVFDTCCRGRTLCLPGMQGRTQGFPGITGKTFFIKFLSQQKRLYEQNLLIFHF
ncbi:MAG: hypothetical protein D3923_01340 [Candidatus Electrothrix sp. AR3]|nr:hypothetical protein [Candidatus Electrothrix sp. AR3]